MPRLYLLPYFCLALKIKCIQWCMDTLSRWGMTMCDVRLQDRIYPPLYGVDFFFSFRFCHIQVLFLLWASLLISSCHLITEHDCMSNLSWNLLLTMVFGTFANSYASWSMEFGGWWIYYVVLMWRSEDFSKYIRVSTVIYKSALECLFFLIMEMLHRLLYKRDKRLIQSEKLSLCDV